jgi:phage terminase small subunit
MASNLKPLDQLPVKYQLFVLGMITHKGDKTKAARSAGYSPKTCEQQGNRLFRKVKEYIEPLTKDLVKAYALKAEQVVQGLSLLASADIRDYAKWDKDNTVTFKSSEELTPAQAYCIESVKQVETQFSKTIELKLAKKQPALDSLAQFHSLFRRTPASKGLVVVFEDGTVHGGTTPAKKRDVLALTKSVEVTFEDAEPGPTMKGGNGHG